MLQNEQHFPFTVYFYPVQKKNQISQASVYNTTEHTIFSLRLTMTNL